MVRAVLVSILALIILAACSGGSNHSSSRDLDATRVALEEAKRVREQAEAEKRRLQEEAKKLTPHEAAEKKRWEAFQEEWRRQMAEAEARRQRETERQRLEAERQQRLTAERDMGVWDNAVIAVTVGDETLPLPWFRNREVYLPWEAKANPPDPAPIPRRTVFGPWADTSMNIHADMGAMSFGVRQDPNGTYLPWMSGPEIHGDFTGLRPGGMTWTGVLVGFTPQGEAVTGKATLSNLDFETAFFSHARYATVDLNLDDLVYRDTSVVWGDGDLFYRAGLGTGGIDHSRLIRNKTFTFPYGRIQYTDPVDPKKDQFPVNGFVTREDNPDVVGDEGEVHGMFFGPKHEGMAGTLRRDDLTAAFGGKR